MKNYFLISEFAKLRDININSLRYYEKLGLLKPAYVDEKTNYRYYAPEQISVLNKIILCVQLGIPLKEMVQYIDEDGNLQSQKLLKQGKLVAQKRIEEMQNNLKYIETSLKYIEDNKKFADKQGIYIRQMEERHVIVTDYFDKKLEIKEMVSAVGEIYKIAQKNDLFPVLPAGQILEIDEKDTIRYRCFLEILNRKEELTNVLTIPKGEYACTQVELHPNLNIIELIKEKFGHNEKKVVIVDNMMLEKYSFETRPSELQKMNLECF